MGLNEPILAELKLEAVTTRRMLERVPQDSLGWKPHEKSMTLGRLAGHIAELPKMLVSILAVDELDLSSGMYQPFIASNVSELLEQFDKNVADATESLKNQSDEHLFKLWRLRSGERVHFDLPLLAVVRSMALNHFIHHRGQLSVYLRLLDVPLPSIYGPSADESAF